MDWLQLQLFSLVGDRTGAIESIRKFMFIGKILVSNKYKEVTVREEECHSLKKGGNKPSDRRSLLTPTLPPEEGKRRKRERDLLIEYKQL